MQNMQDERAFRLPKGRPEMPDEGQTSAKTEINVRN